MTLLQGKRTLVIGAGSGIGAAAARVFAAEGARMACADLDAARGRANADEIGGAFFALDIADRTAVHATGNAAARALGGLDIVVNTPFHARAHPDILGLTQAQFALEWGVLAGGTLWTFQAAIPHLRAAGGGVLLTTSSGLFGDYGAYAHPAIIPAYGMAKGAQEILTKTAAMLHAREGIRVCAVQPGFTHTEGARATMDAQGVSVEQFGAVGAAGMPLGVGVPEAVAEGFVFLASSHASYINGFTLLVDGGSYAGHFGRMLA
jgi:NAD(P)-dependent dehydrogenase (short-subunit alcohol dehydrogenase family)